MLIEQAIVREQLNILTAHIHMPFNLPTRIHTSDESHE